MTEFNAYNQIDVFHFISGSVGQPVQMKCLCLIDTMFSKREIKLILQTVEVKLFNTSCREHKVKMCGTLKL